MSIPPKTSSYKALQYSASSLDLLPVDCCKWNSKAACSVHVHCITYLPNRIAKGEKHIIPTFDDCKYRKSVQHEHTE